MNEIETAIRRRAEEGWEAATFHTSEVRALLKEIDELRHALADCVLEKFPEQAQSAGFWGRAAARLLEKNKTLGQRIEHTEVFLHGAIRAAQKIEHPDMTPVLQSVLDVLTGKP